MKSSSSQYLIIVEYSQEKTGFIIGTYSSEAKAKLLVKPTWEEFEHHYRFSEDDLPPLFFRIYQSYQITGEEYFSGSEKYQDRQTLSNGFQTLSVIRCQGMFDFKEFVEDRNHPHCFN